MTQINKNILSKDLSPYLRQHKDNPVNWQTWSNECLKFARQNKKPILLSGLTQPGSLTQTFCLKSEILPAQTRPYTLSADQV